VAGFLFFTAKPAASLAPRFAPRAEADSLSAMKRLATGLLAAAALLLAACATRFPEPAPAAAGPDGPDAATLLAQCVAAHGGDLRDSVNELHLSLTGEWGTLIRRIQPLVTDYGYRIDANERHLLDEDRSVVDWSGPSGRKHIDWRPPRDITVAYDDAPSTDPDVLASTAMTAEAFRLFHLAPSYLAWRGGEPLRLDDETVDGRRYHRLLFTLEPGFGFAERDRVVAYVDADSKRLFRLWITLEGFRTTLGATVDLTYLEFQEVDGFLLPRRLDERVRAPIGIHAHEWIVGDVELIRH